jgi:CelD/BcsL family acetyltransferase involved in cellulose biosynthesis
MGAGPAAGDGLHARLVPLRDLAPGDLDAWRDLALRAVEPNPFFEPQVVLPAARGLGVEDLSLVVVTDAAGTWRACAPVRRVPRWRRLRLPCIEIWSHTYSGIEVPLACAESMPGAARLLVDHLRAQRGAAFVVVGQMPLDGPVDAAVRGRGTRVVVLDRFERAVVRRRPQETYVAEAMKPKRRRDLERLRRRLERDTGGPVTCVDRADDPSAVEDFLALEAAGWKGANGTALACDTLHARFFREMCEGFARDGRLQLVSLSAGGRTIAMKCNLMASDRLFTFKQAYDEEFSDYSPGRLVEMDNLRHFHRSTTAVLMDSMAHPENRYINGLWPDRRPLGTLLVPARGPLGAIAGALVSLALAARVVRRPTRRYEGRRAARAGAPARGGGER